MKNIHLIPTDKPSRLLLSKRGHLQWLNDKSLLNTYEHFEGVCQNIYITSSEEIKEGDWVITYNGLLAKVITEITWHFMNSKKIILTTDQDLIADDVQAIPDEFIEWFIENPKCEEVEVEKIQFNPVFEEDDLSYDEMTAYYSYKIIIPKEQIISSEEDAKIFVDAINNAPEPNEKLKKAFKNFKYVGECKGNQNGCFLDSCGHDCGCFTRVVKEEPKQETTLEEAAENEASIFYEKGTIEWNKYRQVFELGAKHQQERMYSEKEVKHIVSEALQSALVKVDLEQWFKQFKKTT
jgi:hypothetical protein